jgi:NhaP-type Na+/H+ or K+/H+ antiporter
MSSAHLLVILAVAAVTLVVVTAAGAAVAHSVGHLSWPMAFILGTAVGPTDAAAATSIARHLGLRKRLVAILEGEALFNDATALVLYAAAVAAATTGQFSIGHTARTIGYSAVVGGAIGLAVGLVGRWVRRRIEDPQIDIAGSILMAYAAYLPADAVGASGVLAAVTAGLYLGWRSGPDTVAERVRLQSTAFWEMLVFGINGVLFVLVGLSFHTFSSQARGSIAHLAVTAAAVVGLVIGLRLAWMWAFSAILRARRRERLVLGWSGMRGAITLAALLAVPRVTADDQPLAGRDDIVYLGFAVIFVTLVAQGLTLPSLIKVFGLREDPVTAPPPHDLHIGRTAPPPPAPSLSPSTEKSPNERTAGMTSTALTVQPRPQTQPVSASGFVVAAVHSGSRHLDAIVARATERAALTDEQIIFLTVVTRRPLSTELTRIRLALARYNMAIELVASFIDTDDVSLAERDRIIADELTRGARELNAAAIVLGHDLAGDLAAPTIARHVASMLPAPTDLILAVPELDRWPDLTDQISTPRLVNA